jgi:3-deoxy-manno-octulosonate cytidylyltransferase (CMP-KDO synthetase)
MGTKSVICIIPARYGSTRLPAKALIEVSGVPLVMWAYRAAADSGVFGEVTVATDDQRIVDAVEQHGGTAVMTSPDHERGSDRAFEAAGATDHRFVVNLQGDEPEIPPELLATFVANLKVLVDDNSLLTCVSHAPAEQIGDPNTVKVVLNARGEALYFSRAPIPYSHGEATAFMKHTGIYGFTREGLGRYCGFGPGRLERTEKLEQLRALENGMTIHCLYHTHASNGIDTPADLEAFRRRVESPES